MVKKDSLNKNLAFEDFNIDEDDVPKLLHYRQGWYCRRPFIKKRYILGAIALLVVVALVLGACYFTGIFSKTTATKTSSSEAGKELLVTPEAKAGTALVPPEPTKPIPSSGSRLRTFSKAAVCADYPKCAEIGRDILAKNGTAADAIIATLFCNGVTTMQSMGLGGGFLMTIYKKNEKKAYFLNAREKAPLKASKEIYKGDHLKPRNGPLAVAVPGELRGYWALHRKFGTMPWKDLIQPTVDLCNEGYEMSNHQYNSLKNQIETNAKALDDPNLKEWFKDENGNIKKMGTKIIPKKLCTTLAIIAMNGGDDLYNGTLAKMFVDDLKDANGIITKEDMEQYEAEWLDPISITLRNQETLHTSPPPGSGAILGLIMNILDGYNFTKDSIDGIDNTVLTYHRMVEAFKYAYAKRTELGDTNFVNIKEVLANLTSREYAESIRKQIMDNTTFQDPKHYGAIYYNKEDHGTAHMSIIDQNGDAISVTSSINLYFGAGITSKRTGIIFNSVMDDFSFPYYENYFGLPGSPNNEMKPGKRPLSSMSPTITVDKEGEAKIVVGASGGSVITTSVAWTIIRSLWFGENIKEAVDAPRIHHQLFPMEIAYEYGVLQQVLDGLRNLGHKTKRGLISVICALKREAKDKITANADHRKMGDVYGLT